MELAETKKYFGQAVISEGGASESPARNAHPTSGRAIA
jgi:hypothetical protein